MDTNLNADVWKKYKNQEKKYKKFEKKLFEEKKKYNKWCANNENNKNQKLNFFFFSTEKNVQI